MTFDRGLEILTKRIESQLKQRGFCVVFEDEIARCWPSEEINPSERLSQIAAFVKSRGWNASFLSTENSGTRVIFEDR
jgi:muramoyltetrapeptide carboxypeptidase LdcA involved in peptidoglycan recycling